MKWSLLQTEPVCVWEGSANHTDPNPRNRAKSINLSNPSKLHNLFKLHRITIIILAWWDPACICRRQWSPTRFPRHPLSPCQNTVVLPLIRSAQKRHMQQLTVQTRGKAFYISLLSRFRRHTERWRLPPLIKPHSKTSIFRILQSVEGIKSHTV